MAEKNNAVIYGEIIAKCWDSEDFKKKFLADPEGVLADAGFKLEEGVTYKVIEAPKLVQYVVIPAEDPKDAVQKISAGLLNRVENDENILPEGTELRIIQNTDDVRHLILPASPKNLTADELKAISGGDGASIAVSSMSQVVNVSTTVAVACPQVNTNMEVAVGIVVVLI